MNSFKCLVCEGKAAPWGSKKQVLLPTRLLDVRTPLVDFLTQLLGRLGRISTGYMGIPVMRILPLRV